MIPWTTPTLTCTVEGIDLTQMDIVLVSVKQGSMMLEKVGTVTHAAATQATPETSTVTATFSQAETSRLREGEAEVQLNWLNGDARDASCVKKILVSRQLHRAVME